MPKVISYTRFSSRRQASGDSYRRQTEMAMTWCRDNGLELDTDLRLEDLGVSGYSGANLKNGELGALLVMCEKGQIEPGTILLVEAFDRLTRLPLVRAMNLIINLLLAGLKIVTLADKKVWDETNMDSLEPFLVGLLTVHKGHQESEHKSGRLRQVFDVHRKQGSQNVFGTAPGWLVRVDKLSPWTVISEKAESVKKVFQLAAMGYGSPAIAKRANEEGWIVPTRLNQTEGRWHAQMPGQLLRNRAVLGEHEHRIRNHEENAKHWRGAGTGIVISDYYPRIVSDDEWHLTRASISTRSVVNRRDTHYFNVFAGLLYCGNCGAPMQRKNETRGRSRGQFVCSDRLAGVTNCPSSSIRGVDFELLKTVYEMNHFALGGDDGEKTTELLAKIDSQLAEKEQKIINIINTIEQTATEIPALSVRLRALQNEINVLKSTKDIEYQKKALGTQGTIFDETWIAHNVSHLYGTDLESRDVRVSLHLQLSRVIDTIWLWPYEVAVVKFKLGLVAGSAVSIPLQRKRLPSRANPDAKYHKPPKEKPEVVLSEKYTLAQRGELILPVPKRRWNKFASHVTGDE